MKKMLVLLMAGMMASFARADFRRASTFKVEGYAGSSELTNMPVLVRLASDVADECRADGADIQFTSEDGEMVYPHEIDVWNPASESLVWVKLPVLRPGVKFKLNYGDAGYTGPAEPQAKGAVWDDAGYIGVWHMSEESGSVANMTSKTGVGDASLDAVPAGARSAYSVRHTANAAPVGYARFTGATDSNNAQNTRAFLKVADYSNHGLGSKFIVSGWYYMTEYNSDGSHYLRNARIFSRKTTWDSDGGFDTGLDNSSDTQAFMRGKVSGTKAAFSGVPSAKQNWVHAAFVFNDTSATAYFNGLTVKTGTISAATDNGLPLGIGSNVNPGENNDSYLAGSFDEVRLLKIDSAKSADYYRDWVQAEYAMVDNPDFLTVTPEVMPFEKTAYGLAATFAVGYEWPSEALDADKADMPVLVRVREGQPAGFSYGNCAANGSDIAFCSTDGETEYAFDCDTWNPQGESCFWVRLPDASQGVSFLMLFGGTKPMMARSRSAVVWSDYVGVWHLGEASGSAKDSTGNGFVGTPMGSASGTPAKNIMVAYPNGVVGAARVNGTTNGKGLTYMSVPSYDAYELGDSFTISGWFLANGIDGWPRLFSRKKVNSDNNGFEIEVNNGSKTAAQARGSTSTANSMSWPDLTKDWMYLTLVYDGTTMTGYANGVKTSGETAIVAVTDNGLPLSFGCNSNGSEASFNGQYDEIRLCDGAKGAVRIAAEYATMHDATFVASTGASTSPFIEVDSFAVECDLGDFVTGVSVASGFSHSIGVIPLTENQMVFAPSDEVTMADGRKFRVKSWEVWEAADGGDFERTTYAVGAPNFTYFHTPGTDAKLVLTLETYQAPSMLGHGEVSGGGWFGLGDTATFTATGDNFVGWFVGSECVSTSMTYSFEFAQTRDVRAYFADMVNLVTDVDNPPDGAEGVFFSDFVEAAEFATVCGMDSITVYPGTYVVAEDAVLPAGVALTGIKNANGDRPIIDFSKNGKLTANDGAEITGFGFARPRSGSTAVVLKSNVMMTDCLVSDLGDYFYVVAADGTGVEIRNCTFTNCVSTSKGGGIVNCMAGSSVLIEDVVVDGCKHSIEGQYGGVFHTENASGIVMTVRHCRVINSSARNAAFRIDGGKAIVENSLFAGNDGMSALLACNSADQGGTKFTNCTFVNNKGAIASLRCVFDSCILWTKDAETATVATTDSQWEHVAQINHCCYREATADAGRYGAGNISDEPTFKDGTYEPLADSPYVNKGNPNSAWTADDVDLAGNRRVSATRVDMGCFEFQLKGFVLFVR